MLGGCRGSCHGDRGASRRAKVREQLRAVERAAGATLQTKVTSPGTARGGVPRKTESTSVGPETQTRTQDPPVNARLLNGVEALEDPRKREVGDKQIRGDV